MSSEVTRSNRGRYRKRGGGASRKTAHRSHVPTHDLKFVIRHLPPTLPESIFLDALKLPLSGSSSSDLFTYFKYCQGKPGNVSQVERPSRAYLVFQKMDQRLTILSAFENHTFQSKSSSSNELSRYKVRIQKAPLQRIPLQKQPDPLMNTLSSDSEFIAFQERLKNECGNDYATLPRSVVLSLLSIENLEQQTQQEPISAETPLVKAMKMKYEKKSKNVNKTQRLQILKRGVSITPATANIISTSDTNLASTSSNPSLSKGPHRRNHEHKNFKEKSQNLNSNSINK